jgi:PPOX class probable F420-dependent enzyme
MTATIPTEAQDLLTSAVPVVVSYHDADGRIVSHPLWVEEADGLFRFSTPRGSRKTEHLRRDPEVGLIFTDHANPYRYLSASGRVVETHDDVDLVTIDRLAHRYIGSAYGFRDREREVFVIEPSRVIFSPGTWG